MNKLRDNRLRVLILTIAAISLIGILIQQLGNSNIEKTTADNVFDSRQHAIHEKQSEIARRYEQAVLMLHAEQYDYAVTALHRVLELAPAMPEAHVNMGFALLGQGNVQAARDFFRSAIELRPAQANSYWGLAVSLEALCDIEGAIGAMRTFIHLEDPNNKFITRARSAIWEWESRLSSDKQTSSSDKNVASMCRSESSS